MSLVTFASNMARPVARKVLQVGIETAAQSAQRWISAYRQKRIAASKLNSQMNRAATVANSRAFQPVRKLNAQKAFTNKWKYTNIEAQPQLSFPKKRRMAKLGKKKSRGARTVKIVKRRTSAKKTKKTKKKRTNYNSIYVTEKGGIQADPSAVYIGHGLANTEFIKAICRTIVHILYKKAGVDFNDFRDIPENNVTDAVFFVLRSRLRLTQTVYDETTIQPALSSSFGTMADNLTTQFLATLDNTREPFDIKLTTLNTDEDQTIATMLFKEVTFHFKVVSTLKLQNTTIAASTGTDNDLNSHVSANPLVGKLYTRNSSGFDPRFRIPGAVTNYKHFLVNAGLIQANSTFSANVGTKKPPPGSFFGAKAVAKMWEPGQITVDKMQWEYHGTYDKILQQFGNVLTTSVVSNNKMAHSRMYGMEKLVDTRTNEPNITVGFELVQEFYSGGTLHKIRFKNPFLDVNDTAITNPVIV